MDRTWSTTVACIVSSLAVSSPTIALPAQNEGFVFSGDQAVSATDKRQFIRVWEKLSVSQLKKRFPSYSVSAIESDCGGTCTLIEGEGSTYIRIDYGGDRKWSFYRIYSDARSSRDTSGNVIGTSLRKAVGANTTKCDRGEDTTCESVLIKGLSYIVGGCPFEAESIPACAKVAGFEISATQVGPRH
jgi:hypothetical protein